MVQHTTAGFLQRLFLLLSGIAPTCFIGVTPLQLAVCVVSGADGTQATPESEYCTGTHSRPMRIHRETFAKTLEWETHVFCRGCWAGRWMPETADGHPCFSLREWSAEIEAKEKENTAERERERERKSTTWWYYSRPWIQSHLQIWAPSHPVPFQNLFLIKPAGIAHTEFINFYLFNKCFIAFPKY